MFCELQNISCMKPSLLIGNMEIEARFKHLLWTCLTFVKTWDKVAPDVQRMYAKCKPAQEVLEEEVQTELKVLLTLSCTLMSLSKHTTADPAPGCLSRRRIAKMIYFKL